MLPIFEKLEAVKIDSVELLQPEDKAFCRDAFILFNSHDSFIKNLFETTKNVYKSHFGDKPDKVEDFLYEMIKLEKYLDELKDISGCLKDKLVRKIENYFESRYNIKFVSYWLKDKVADALSLENIIDNIIEQSGADLMQAGVTQVIRRLQERFSYSGNQPLLKNNKISFPNYFYPRSRLDANDVSLDHDDKEISRLLDAIALFLFDTPIQPEIFSDQLEEWKQNIDLTISYCMQEDTYIKFFKNRRVDILFSSAENAGKFWQMFGLENIVELNSSRA